MKLSAMHSPTFERDDADEVLMHPIARQGAPRHLGAEAIDALPTTIKPIYDRPIEPDDVVRSLIVRYNFLKYRAIKLQKEIADSPTRAADLDQFDRLLERINKARGEVIAAMLPVALSLVRRQQMATQQGEGVSLITMLKAAHDVLIEEIDRYDAGVAHPFESVLTNRLMRVLARPASAVRGEVDELLLFEQLAAAGFKLET